MGPPYSFDVFVFSDFTQLFRSSSQYGKQKSINGHSINAGKHCIIGCKSSRKFLGLLLWFPESKYIFSRSGIQACLQIKYLFQSYFRTISEDTQTFHNLSHIFFGLLLLAFCNICAVLGIILRYPILIIPWLLYYFIGENNKSYKYNKIFEF